jgi:hypothetical protein
MSLIKKVDVDKHFAARRAMRLGRTGPLGQIGARIEPAAKAKSSAAFIEVVAPESIAIDSAGTRASTVTRSRQA